MAIDGYGQEEEILGKAYDARLARRLGQYLKPYRSHIIIAIIVYVIGTIAEASGPFILKRIIDEHIVPKNIDGLMTMILLFAGIIICQAIFQYIGFYLTQWVGQKSMYDIRMDIFSHIEKMGLSFFDKNPVGRLVTRSTSDVGSLNEFFTSGVVTIFKDVIMLAAIVCFMLYINWKMALVTFAVLPFLFAATIVFRNKVRDSFRKVRTRIARLNAFLQEHVSGMWVVQSFAAGRKAYRNFDFINSDLRDNHLRSVFYFALFYPVVEILGAISVALIIWYGGAMVLAGILTLGALTAFIQYTDMFFEPIRDLSEKYNILQQAMASSERIFKLLDHPVDIAESLTPKKLIATQGAIRFENLHFAYNENDWILKGINLDIKAGEKIAIVGATGAGKTSIISLLLRFYEFQKGDIKIDGVSIRELPLAEYRSQIALVLQDVFLFSGDIARNIRLGNKGISDHDIREAIRTVGGETFVSNLDGGINHMLRERGSNLSVGQRQLLSFARALAFDPKILILDEATSSVDTQTELLIQDALRKLLEGRTSIIVAHRLSTIKYSDRIIVMHKGAIKEEGTHNQLLAQRGIYHRLYELQYKEQEIAGRVA
jgi:ATP-binding cassette, subfamily B, multidrug efflux pump